MERKLREELISLERKALLLVKEHKYLKEELEKTKKENLQLKSKLQYQEQNLADFQNKIKLRNIVDSLEISGDGEADLKEVINKYIVEIDKCINHLSEVN